MAQSSITFCAELKSLGVVIPDNTQEINIVLQDAHKPVQLWFKVLNIDSAVVKKVKGNLSTMSAPEFYNKLKERVALPEFTSKLSIKAKINSITMMTIEAALPADSLSFLKA